MEQYRNSFVAVVPGPAVLISLPQPLSSPARRARVAVPSFPDVGREWLLRGPFLLCLAALPAAFLLLPHEHAPLLRGIFLTALATAAEALPVTGPHGRRVSLSDAIGPAALLLLPPPLAPLPALLAGGLRAAVQRTRPARRQVLTHALVLGGAVLTGGIIGHLSNGILGVAACALLCVGARDWRSVARRNDAGLDAAALLAGMPAALLMAALWPAYGLAGGAAAAALLGLLLVVAHFAFETVLLREQVRAMERLGAVTLGRDNLGRLVERFLQLGGGLVSSRRSSLWLADDAEIRLERVARLEAAWTAADGQRTQTLSAGPATVRFGEGLIGRVAERRLPLIVQDGANDRRASEAERRGRTGQPFSLLLLPLSVGGELVGVAQFERDDPQPYTRRDLGRVRALANQAAAAISNAQRHRAVTDQAVTDGLTGLFNRRHIQATLESEQRRAQRYGHQFSLIMLDIDHFKGYNDTYGHTQGDVLITMVATLLRANVRAVDVVGRYGGEEFIVLMPETSKVEAAHTAERLRQAVVGTAFPGHADDPESVVTKTISLGVATLPEDAADAAMLVTRADQALYEAKRGGRNRAVVAEAAMIA